MATQLTSLKGTRDMKIFPQYKSANKLTLIAASIIGLTACGSDDGSDGIDGTDQDRDGYASELSRAQLSELLTR